MPARAFKAGAESGKAPPGLGPAEVIPQFLEGAVGIGNLGQDAGHDPPPPAPLRRLVRRQHPLLRMNRVALKMHLESAADLLGSSTTP